DSRHRGEELRFPRSVGEGRRGEDHRVCAAPRGRAHDGHGLRRSAPVRRRPPDQGDSGAGERNFGRFHGPRAARSRAGPRRRLAHCDRARGPRRPDRAVDSRSRRRRGARAAGSGLGTLHVHMGHRARGARVEQRRAPQADAEAPALHPRRSLSGPLPFLVVAPLAFASALLMTPIFVKIARSTGYLDHPDPRKSHAEPTPLLGGVAVAVALLLAAALGRAFFSIPIALPRPGFFIGAALSLGMGLLDDRRPMPPLGKLAGQLAAALCLVLWGPQVEWIRASPLTLAAAILGVMALLNAINFLDAMDGIVGATVPITAAGFVAIGLLHHAPVDLILAWGLVGAGAGFLVYNAPPARIFLGDAGSHLLGFALAALTLQALQGPPTIPHLSAV